MSRERLMAGLAMIAVLASMAEATRAQERWDSPDAFVDLTFLAAEPVGDFARSIDGGWGFGIGGRVPMDARGILSMRVDLGFINYGSERLFACSFTCRVGFNVQTNNNILFMGAGPELAAPLGPVRPYVGVEGGLGYFLTTSSLRGDRNYRSFASSTNFDDAVLQWRGRGGIQFRLSSGKTPVFLDLGAEYHRNGIAEYLREGDIVDEPDGSITVFPTRGEANLWTLRLGVSIGVRGGDGNHDKGRRR
jgi:hypothetical protein